MNYWDLLSIFVMIVVAVTVGEFVVPDTTYPTANKWLSMGLCALVGLVYGRITRQ